MIVVMEVKACQNDIKKMRYELNQKGVTYKESFLTNRTLFSLAGNKKEIEKLSLSNFPGVECLTTEWTNLPLIGDNYGAKRQHNIAGFNFSKDKFLVIAGPCSVESQNQLLEIAASIKISGADMLRGGAFKPRSSPYSFQGLGLEGLKLLKQANNKFNLPVVSEIMSISQIELAYEYIDIIQVGARNMYNYQLLKELGKQNKPILLKRSFAATIEEWLSAAEYIAMEGNENIILCERGIRTFSQETRNTLDLSVIPIIKKRTHLPIIIDPSHATGHWWMVESMSLASLAAGADGIMVEVHNEPEKALSDGDQSLKLLRFQQLMEKLDKLKRVMY